MTINITKRVYPERPVVVEFDPADGLDVGITTIGWESRTLERDSDLSEPDQFVGAFHEDDDLHEMNRSGESISSWDSDETGFSSEEMFESFGWRRV